MQAATGGGACPIRRDQLQSGRRLCELAVIDNYTREALVTEARGPFLAHAVIQSTRSTKSRDLVARQPRYSPTTRRRSRRPPWIRDSKKRMYGSTSTGAASPRTARPSRRSTQRAAARGLFERARPQRCQVNLDFAAERLQ